MSPPESLRQPKNRYRKLAIAKRVRLGYQCNHKPANKQIYSEEDRYKLHSKLETVDLGEGVLGFFKMEKTLAILFWVLSLIAVGEIIINMLFTPKSTSGDIITFLTLGNYVVAASQAEKGDNSLLLIFGTVALEALYLVIYWIFIERLERKVSAKSTLPLGEFRGIADYSVFVENIPTEIKNADEIANHFNKFAPVHSVLLVYDVHDHGKAQREIDQYLEQYHLARLANDPSVQGALHFRDHYMSMNKSLINFHAMTRFSDFSRKDEWKRKVGLLKDQSYYLDKIETLIQARTCFTNPEMNPTTGCAFVTFSDSWAQERVLSIFRDSDQKNCIGVPVGQKPILMLRNRVLFVSPAPAPSDTIFDNIGISLSKRRLSNAIVFGVTFVFAAIGVVSITVIRYNIRKVSDFVISTMISLANTLISKVVQFVVINLQRFSFPLTFSANERQSSTRLFVADFGMNALVFLLLSLVIQPIEFFGPVRTIKPKFYFLSPDWFSTIVMMFFTNVLIDAAIVVVLELTQIIELVFSIPAFLTADSKDQSSLNQAYMPSPWPVASRLAQIVKMVWICVLVSACAPFLVPILALFFTIEYFVDKHNVLRVYEQPRHYSNELVGYAVKMLGVGVHVHAIFTNIVLFFILSQQHSMANNPAKLWPAIAYLLVYLVFLCVLFGTKMCRNTRRASEVVKEKRWIEYKRKRGHTYPMSTLERYVETYIDSHPLYSPITHRLSFSPGSECNEEIRGLGLSHLDLGMVFEIADGQLALGKKGVETNCGPELRGEMRFYSFYSQTAYFRRRRRKAQSKFVTSLRERGIKDEMANLTELVSMDVVASQTIRRAGAIRKMKEKERRREMLAEMRAEHEEERERRRDAKKLAWMQKKQEETGLEYDTGDVPESELELTSTSNFSRLTTFTQAEIDAIDEMASSEFSDSASSVEKELRWFETRFNEEYQLGHKKVLQFTKEHPHQVARENSLTQEELRRNQIMHSLQRQQVAQKAHDNINFGFRMMAAVAGVDLEDSDGNIPTINLDSSSTDSEAD
ncbi:putative calcium permeable stress-gated cation channel [Blattamonas nauphoetae]|uniref:Calcium permeable stress-gated cation channel n=1 Tax=Blattamonas nauphoetae TaxID=2049346 RepID=A0ABQ9Y350_9EUKA|nr:putative calcium permeable stress-gated cation channel [Blattamonas nauphoetae]